MSCSEHAHLAYGFVLYSFDEWKVEEADESGSLGDIEWLDDVDPIRSMHRKLLIEDGLAESEYEANRWHEERLLMERRGLGFNLFGNWERQGSGYFLHAGPVQQASPYAPRVIHTLKSPSADENLEWAISVLGLTPTQKVAQWMMYPSYR